MGSTSTPSKPASRAYDASVDGRITVPVPTEGETTYRQADR